jgi:hypothetical protein
MSDDPETPESRDRRAAIAVVSLKRAADELEALAATETDRGRQAVYHAWARHLLDDWRGVALLAARIDPESSP